MNQRIVDAWSCHKHNTSFFNEFSIDPDRVLTVFHIQAKKQAPVSNHDEWKIDTSTRHIHGENEKGSMML